MSGKGQLTSEMEESTRRLIPEKKNQNRRDSTTLFLEGRKLETRSKREEMMRAEMLRAPSTAKRTKMRGLNFELSAKWRVSFESICKSKMLILGIEISAEMPFEELKSEVTKEEETSFASLEVLEEGS